jgi:hypothetical protein
MAKLQVFIIISAQGKYWEFSGRTGLGIKAVEAHEAI